MPEAGKLFAIVFKSSVKSTDSLLERLLGLAAVQARTPEEGEPHFDESIRLARSLGAEYELGRTLHAKVVTGFASEAEASEAEAILERLGIVALPSVPLP